MEPLARIPPTPSAAAPHLWVLVGVVVAGALLTVVARRATGNLVGTVPVGSGARHRPPGAALVGTIVLTVAAAQLAAPAAGAAGPAQPPPSGRPATVYVLGDSTALTLGAALAATAPAGTRVSPHGQFGCGVALGTWASEHPPKREIPMFPACNTSSPPADQWPAIYRLATSTATRRDVVLFFGGTWEVQDILRDGRWTNITHPAFQRYLAHQLQELVDITTAHGAHLLLATLAATDARTLRGTPLPEDAPRRHRLYNGLVERIARRDRGRVSVLDLDAILSPGGRYRLRAGGVQIRTADGTHTPAYAPGNVFVGNSDEQVAQRFDAWLSPKVWPHILAASAGRP